jgi:thioredoxin 1
MKKLIKILLIGCTLLATQHLSANESLVQLNATNYLSTLLKSKKPVVIKFWAPWCRPCRKMTPKYKKAAKSFKGKVLFTELNIDTYKDVARRYSVRGIPTMILFKNGKIVNRSTGSLNQKAIEAFIKSSL